MAKIVQITAASSPNEAGQQVGMVFGLGDDGLVYYWNSTIHRWDLYA